MNREKEFIAWDNISKQMFDVYSIEFRSDGIWVCLDWVSKVTGFRENWLSQDRMEIMQYTGLKDKNNKKVFKFDILKHQIEDKTYYSIIDWNDRLARFELRNLKENLLMPITFVKEREIIGNKWENPELL